jgi:hypothetical protein
MEKNVYAPPCDDQGCTVVVIGSSTRVLNQSVVDMKDKYLPAALKTTVLAG